MKIVTLFGSPRKKGNTDTVLSRFEQLAREQQHEVQRIFIPELKIADCLGCRGCSKTLDAPGCVIHDDLGLVMQAMFAADLVVYAAPVYAWSFPAQMKALLDRHFCLVKWRDGKKATQLLAGKRMALLVTCGGSEAEETDCMRTEFERETAYLGCQMAGQYVLDHCGEPAAVRADPRTLALAQRMSAELLKSV